MLEKEIKISLLENEFYIIKNVLKNLSTTVDLITQTNYYYDTKELDLFHNKETFRIREILEDYEITYKGKKSNTGNNYYNIREENSLNISKENAELFILERKIPLKNFDVLNISTLEDLNLLGNLKTERLEFKFTNNMNIVLDKNSYINFTDYELECETEKFDETIMFLEAIFKKSNLIMRPSNTSKFERFVKKLLK